MKIAFIVSAFPVLSETFILSQITGLLELSHDISIFASKKTSGMQHPDIEKYCLLERSYFFNIPENKIKRIIKAAYLLFLNFHKNPAAILKSLNAIKFKKMALSLELFYKVIPFLKKDFDVIHCHFGPNGLIGAAINEIVLKSKLLTSFHGSDLSQYLNLNGAAAYNYLFDKGDLFLPVSIHWVKKLISLGCSSAKIKLHRMGVDTDIFKPLKKSNQNKTIQLLSVGRFVEKKGFKYGILAFSEALKNHPDMQYNIIGDGYLKENIKKLIKELNCEGKINLMGGKTQNDIIKIMQESDILLAPSITSKDGDSEGIPVVIMEAMSTGLPVISTLHSAIPELVIDNVTGFLTPEKNTILMTGKIKQLVENKKLRTAMGSSGREKILKEYNIKKLNKELVNIYSALYD